MASMYRVYCMYIMRSRMHLSSTITYPFPILSQGLQVTNHEQDIVTVCYSMLQWTAPYLRTQNCLSCTVVHTYFWLTCTQNWLTCTHKLGGWGRAREEKGRIYQPQPFFNLIIGTQPLLDLPSHFNLGGWGWPREDKGRIYQPQPLTSL